MSVPVTVMVTVMVSSAPHSIQALTWRTVTVDTSFDAISDRVCVPNSYHHFVSEDTSRQAVLQMMMMRQMLLSVTRCKPAFTRHVSHLFVTWKYECMIFADARRFTKPVQLQCKRAR